MAERSASTQIIQLGVEATPGVAVAANKLLKATSIEIGPQTEFDEFSPDGSKFVSIVSLGKEWSAGNLRAKPTYQEALYQLAAILGAPTTTLATGGTTSHQHVMAPNPSAPDTLTTFTMEQGSSVRAHRVAGLVINSLDFKYSRSSVEITGSVFGKDLEDPFTLTASPTALAMTPILPKHVSVYLDDAWADLGTTKLLRALSGGFSLGDRQSPLWVVDRAQSSYVTNIEAKPNATATLMVEADAAGMALLASMRNGDKKFMRIEAVGGEVETGVDYLFQVDLAVAVNATNPFRDQDGVYAIEWGFRVVEDEVSGNVIEATVVNELAAL